MRKSIIIVVVVVKFLYVSTMQKIGRFTWKATGVNSIPIDLVLDSSNLFLAAPPMLLFSLENQSKGIHRRLYPSFSLLMEGTQDKGRGQ